MRRKLTATRAMRYSTRMLQAGDAFEATRQDARVLVALGRAVEATPTKAKAEVKPAAKTEAKRNDEAPKAEPVEAPKETKEPEAVDIDVVDPFLDRSVADISADLEGQTLANLKMLRRAEQKGKTRKSLVKALDDEIARRED